MMKSALRGRRLRWPLLLALGALVAGVLLAGCGTGSSGSVLSAAAVNGHSISLTQYQEMTRVYEVINNTPQDWQSANGRTGLAGAQRSALDFLINLELLRQQVAAKHVHPSEKAKADTRKAIRDQLTTSRQQAAVDPRSAALVSAVNADVIELYAEQDADTQALKASPAIKLPSAHLRVLAATTQADAAKFQQQAQQGTDFATLAKAHSQDPSLPAGGDLGTRYQGELPPSFDVALFPTKSSGTPAVSYAIVHDTQYYYLFQISERQPSALSAITDQQQQQTVFSAWLTQQKSNATIDQYVAIK